MKHCVLTDIHLSFSLNLMTGTSSMAKFKVTQFFNIPFRSSRLVSAAEVRLLPPAAGRIKVNIDGSSFGPVPSRAIGGVFRLSHFWVDLPRIQVVLQLKRLSFVLPCLRLRKLRN
ncbi:hypothetical protein MtrunA17_Chr8g0379831 [Medicago truncatula]|uniref:Uncharacterized protein n=1 Tax=Medicago truncatula TaxID=3880 RepID=A0A396GNH2_MEDTR|nr:hypothetical protein MtrunA17_Chr8g0379831 [Medicago truncatula]